MKFEEYIPCDILRPYVQRLAISENAKSQVYKVLPGTSVVIGFQYKGSLSQIIGEEKNRLSSSGVTGILDSYRMFENAVATGTVLVYFKDGCASMFFKTPIHEIFRESVSLDNFMLRSELLVTEEKLQEAKTDNDRISTIEAFLISRLRDTKPDQLVMTAIGIIYQHKGNIKIKDLIKQLFTSATPFEKRFRDKVGISAKKFANIVRLKHAMQRHTPGSSLTQLAYEYGFYDQSHFITAFKEFSGETPETFFSKPAEK